MEGVTPSNQCGAVDHHTLHIKSLERNDRKGPGHHNRPLLGNWHAIIPRRAVEARKDTAAADIWHSTHVPHRGQVEGLAEWSATK